MSGIIPRPARAMALLAMLSLSGFGASGPVSTAYADDCLAAPNSAAPQSSHWYYRIDRVKKLKCWYLHALDEAGHQSVAGARPGIASSVRLQSTDARSASQPGPSVGAPISLTLADSPRPVNKPTVKSHPVTSTVRNPDAEFEWARRFRAIDSPSAGFARLVTGRGFQSPNQVCCARCDTRRKFRGEWARRFASSIYFPNANLAKRRAGG